MESDTPTSGPEHQTSPEKWEVSQQEYGEFLEDNKEKIPIDATVEIKKKFTEFYAKEP